ncbi:hypothetical protein DIPPA_02031 [Diplonema papillatum]|nr:hypothetical protein DIPPA_02031 [Diplonema papillatum]
MRLVFILFLVLLLCAAEVRAGKLKKMKKKLKKWTKRLFGQGDREESHAPASAPRECSLATDCRLRAEPCQSVQCTVDGRCTVVLKAYGSTCGLRRRTLPCQEDSVCDGEHAACPQPTASLAGTPCKNSEGQLGECDGVGMLCAAARRPDCKPVREHSAAGECVSNGTQLSAVSPSGQCVVFNTFDLEGTFYAAPVGPAPVGEAGELCASLLFNGCAGQAALSADGAGYLCTFRCGGGRFWPADLRPALLALAGLLVFFVVVRKVLRTDRISESYTTHLPAPSAPLYETPHVARNNVQAPPNETLVKENVFDWLPTSLR